MTDEAMPPLTAEEHAIYNLTRQIVSPAKDHVTARVGAALSDLAMWLAMDESGSPDVAGWKALAARHSQEMIGEAAVAAWTYSAKIQSQFPNAGAFAGYCKGALAGRVRVLRGR